MRRVVRPEELKEMTDAQLEQLIASQLYNDASMHLSRKYPHKNRAKGLEKLLYRCADCGALYTTESAGSELYCRACGCRHSLDERYRFTSGPSSIPEYYEAIRRMEERELDALSLRAEVKTKIYAPNGGPVRRENGVCTLDTKEFTYRSESEQFSIPVDQLPALAFSCGQEFELYNNNELHYFYPLSEPQQVARWALAVDLMAERRGVGARVKGDDPDGKE